MRFLLTCLWVWLIILRLLPTHYNDPSMTTTTGEAPDTIRFANQVLLDSYGVVVVKWKTLNWLRLKTRGIYRVYPRKLYRGHRPAAVIITLLLASGDIECNPGPVQYPCTVCEKPVKQNQRGIACDHCNQWTHAHCGGIGEAEYRLLTTQEDCQWFCPTCIWSKLSIASFSLSDLAKTIEVSTSLTNGMHPGEWDKCSTFRIAQWSLCKQPNHRLLTSRNGIGNGSCVHVYGCTITVVPTLFRADSVLHLSFTCNRVSSCLDK